MFQRIVFPITTTFEEERHRDLKTAVGSTDFLLLHHLGYLHFNLAVQHSPERRQELFDISQPGRFLFVKHIFCSKYLSGEGFMPKFYFFLKVVIRISGMPSLTRVYCKLRRWCKNWRRVASHRYLIANLQAGQQVLAYKEMYFFVIL